MVRGDGKEDLGGLDWLVSDRSLPVLLFWRTRDRKGETGRHHFYR